MYKKSEPETRPIAMIDGKETPYSCAVMVKSTDLLEKNQDRYNQIFTYLGVGVIAKVWHNGHYVNQTGKEELHFWL